MPLTPGDMKQVRQEWRNSDNNTCARCGNPIDANHQLFTCPTNSAQCWKGAGERKRADIEEFYQSEKSKFDDKNKTKTKAVAQGTTSANPASNAPQERPGTDSNNPPTGPANPGNPAAPDGSSNVPSTPDPQPKQKEKIYTEKVCDVEPLIPDVESLEGSGDMKPYPIQTDHIGDGAGGSKGATSVEIFTNYLRVTEIPDSLRVYSLTFWRPVSKQTSTRSRTERATFNRRREIESAFNAAALSDRLGQSLGQTTWATDYRDLWCTSDLPGCGTSVGDSLDIGPTVWNPPGKSPISDLYVTLTYQPPLNAIRRAFREKSADKLAKESCALNAIIARSIRKTRRDLLPITQVGANKFYLNKAYQEMDTGRLRIQRGYFTSIRPSRSGPLLNVNVANSAFLPPILVSDFLSRNGNDLDYVEKLLRGCFVRITYRRQNYKGGADMNAEQNREKKFVQFGLKTKEQKFFEFERRDEAGHNKTSSSGSQTKQLKTKKPQDNGTTVFDYFTKQLEPRIETQEEIYCVNVGKMVKGLTDKSELKGKDIQVHMREQTEDGAIWIPANLLQICPNQPTKALLNAAHTKSMITTACRRPTSNAALIDSEGLKQLGIKGNQENLVSMGLRTQQNLIQLSARQLQDVTVYMGAPPGARVPVNNASWNLINHHFTNAGTLRKLHVLGFRRSFGMRELKQLGKDLIEQLQNHGMTVLDTDPYAEPRDVHDDNGEQLKSQNVQDDNSKQLTSRNVQDKILKLLREWFPETEKNDCTVVLLKGASESDYAEIKRSADLEHGRHVVCMLKPKIYEGVKRQLGTTMPPSYSQYLSNVSMKVNMKVGGINHTVVPNVPGLDRDKTIILGADVTHPGASQCVGFPSIACVVGSVDRHYMKYLGSMRLQAGRQEEIADLRYMVKERLDAWKKHNRGKIPDCIVFYRDGISESQFKACEDVEIESVKQAWEQFCKESGEVKEMKLTFVVVGKRHNTRFYPKNAKDMVNKMKNNTNLKPGLYVSDKITDPNRTNFYLQSHDAIKGTARSAHYHVLRDDIGFKDLELPNLTHQLCYAFGRATKGVSYAAPAYIADRLCERGRVYLRNESLDRSFSNPVDQNGRPCQTEDDIKQWKRLKARELARTERHWGRHYNDGHKQGPKRWNPWHPDLDNTMFWM